MIILSKSISQYIYNNNQIENYQLFFIMFLPYSYIYVYPLFYLDRNDFFIRGFFYFEFVRIRKSNYNYFD